MVSIQSIVILKLNLKMVLTRNMHHKEQLMLLLEQPKSQPLEEPYFCIWDACDAISFYAWNMQICAGKPEGGAAERNRGHEQC